MVNWRPSECLPYPGRRGLGEAVEVLPVEGEGGRILAEVESQGGEQVGEVVTGVLRRSGCEPGLDIIPRLLLLPLSCCPTKASPRGDRVGRVQIQACDETLYRMPPAGEQKEARLRHRRRAGAPRLPVEYRPLVDPFGGSVRSTPGAERHQPCRTPQTHRSVAEAGYEDEAGRSEAATRRTLQAAGSATPRQAVGPPAPAVLRRGDEVHRRQVGTDAS